MSDGHGGTATGQLSVNVLPVNDIPVAAVITPQTTNEDIGLTVDVTTGAFDEDGDILIVTSATALNGSVAINPDGSYKGNAVADAQIMVASALKDGMLPNAPNRQTAPNSIDDELISWAEGTIATITPRYICNGDSMFHVVKGIIVIRVEDTNGAFVRNNTIEGVENLSIEPFAPCEMYHPLSSQENVNQTQATNIRGISFAAVTGATLESRVRSNVIKDFASTNAQVATNNVIVGRGNLSDAFPFQMKY